jgi:cation transport protein ChaC
LSPDAFRHVPALRGRIKPPAESTLRVTPEVLAAWDVRARNEGRPADWRLPDQQLEGTRLDFLRSLPEAEDLWIFAYGSLMWDPGFHFREVRCADLPGHQRRFAYRTIGGRGTPERPALMLSLERGEGECRGLVFRVDAASVTLETGCVWRREMVRGGYCPTLLTVATPQGDVTALVFAANLAHPDHVGELPLDETACVIATASGMLGSNRDYLERLAAQLGHLGIEDEYVSRLRERVSLLAGA